MAKRRGMRVCWLLFYVAKSWLADVHYTNIPAANLGGFGAGGFIAKTGGDDALWMAPHRRDGVNNGVFVALQLDGSNVYEVDMSGTDSKLVGFMGGFTDGTYAYAVPMREGKVGRVDLATRTDIQALDIFGASGDSYLTRYVGGFCDNDHAYLVPWMRNGIPNAKVARFSLASFSNVEFLDVKTEVPTAGAYKGGFHDGTYGYLIPAKGTCCKVIRFSLAMFAPASVQFIDLKDANAAVDYFDGGFMDGTHGYACPKENGLVARWNLTSFNNPEFLDVSSLGSRFSGGTAHDGYGYLSPYQHSTLVRFKLASFDSPEGLTLSSGSWSGMVVYGPLGILIPSVETSSDDGFAQMALFSLTPPTTTSFTNTVSTMTMTSTTAATTLALVTATATSTVTTAATTTIMAATTTSTRTVSTTSTSSSETSSSSTTESGSSSTTSTRSTSVSDTESTSTTVTVTSSGTSSTVTGTVTTSVTSKTASTSSTPASTSTGSSTTTMVSTAMSTATMTSSDTTTTSATATATSSDTTTISVTTASTSTLSTVTALLLTQVQRVDDLLGKVAETQFRILKALEKGRCQANSTCTEPSRESDDGVLFGSRLNGSDTSLTIPVSRGFVIELPRYFFTGYLSADAARVNGTALLTMSLTDEEVAALGTESAEVLAAATIDLHFLSGPKIPVEGLEEPIVFSLPTLYTSKDIICVFWDNETAQWSRQGVSVNKRSTLGGPLWCETTHLSLFAAIKEGIVDTIVCANFDLVLSDAAGQVFVGNWYTQSGSIVFWCICLAILVAFIVAAVIDRRRSKTFQWKDEFLLVPVVTATAAEEGSVAMSCKEALCVAFSCMASSSSIKEAIDDILSAWCTYFAEIRSILDGLWDGLELCGGLEEGTLALAQFATYMLLFASRRRTAASLGVTDDLVGLVLDDQDLADFLIAQRNRGAVPPSGSKWWLSSDQASAWAILRQAVLEQAVQETCDQDQFFRPILRLFLYKNPISALFAVDVTQSCKQKVAGFAAELFGAFLLSSLLFEASGMLRGKSLRREGCGSGSSFGYKLGRFIVIATSSLLFASLPAAILASLQTKGLKKIEGAVGSEAWHRQLHIWRVQERLYWVASSLYTSVCMAYIMIFLANIGGADHSDWSFAGQMTVGLDFLLLPLLIAFFIPMLAKVLLQLHSRVVQVDRAALVRTACEKLTNGSMLPIEST